MHVCLLPKVDNNLLLLIVPPRLACSQGTLQIFVLTDLLYMNPPSLFRIKKACKQLLISATTTTSADHRLKYIIWTPDVHVGKKKPNSLYSAR